MQASSGVGSSQVQAPSSAQELGALEARRSELKRQLESNTERRSLLDVQMRGAEGATRARFQQRIDALDERTARIDDELTAIDDAISAALKRGVSRPPSGFEQLIQGMKGVPTTPPPSRAPAFQFGSRQNNSELLIALLVGQGLTFLLLALILWRGFRRRLASFARLAPEDANRLDQLQRAVDVMAVEVERISEGQRYVAKVLGEQSPAGIPARAANQNG